MSSVALNEATPVMDGLTARAVRKRLPLNVHFDVTYRCNERCVHCYLDHEDHGELTTAECIEILEQLAAAGTLFLTFSGGEIFLRTDFFVILAAARRLHFDISLKSNALLITPERATRLRELGVRRIQISVYSADPAIHDAVTKVPGSLARTIAAIPLLLAHGLKVKIGCPLMRENILAYRGIMELADKLGVPYMMDMTITPMMDGSREPLAHRVTASDLLTVLQDPVLNACHAHTSGGQTLASVGKLGSGVSSSLENSVYDDIPCSAGHNSCYISPYGDVLPCVQLPKPAGNLRHQRFTEIWHRSPALAEVRSVRDSQLPVCSRCTIRKYCERCPGLALWEGGDLFGAYERACELAEQKARLAGIVDPVSAMHAERMAGVV